jgi:hypothetical protein
MHGKSVPDLSRLDAGHEFRCRLSRSNPMKYRRLGHGGLTP